MTPQELDRIKKRFQLLGRTPTLDQAITTAAQIAPTPLSVLISGENGSGKESFAKIIHHLSERKHAPFVAVNCGAIPEGTMDSELFGHEKGAFTGASGARKGYFEEAEGGTLFLDEIGDMPLAIQPRLLRVLENQEFLPVGSSKKRKSNVRIITATNLNLREKVNRGQFREDLYYRIAQVTITVPPLRERKEDIELLFRKFTLDFAHNYQTPLIQLTPKAQAHLSAYPFPGNVRQLKNIAWQIAALEHKHPLVDAPKLDLYLPSMPTATPPALDRTSAFSKMEREMLFKSILRMQEETDYLKQIIYKILNDHEKGKNIIHQYPVLFKALSAAPSSPIAQLESFSKKGTTPKETITQPPKESTLPSLASQEKALIEKALTKWKSRKKAAQELGIAERTLYRKIKSYGL